jgi:structure-specific recognition protein 1
MSSKANDPDYILNPATNRYVKKEGAIGKKILAGTMPTAKPAGKGKAKPATEKKKRTPSAYILWTQDNRARVKKQNPEAKFGEISKLLGAEWKSLSADKKAPYEKKAASLKATA